MEFQFHPLAQDYDLMDASEFGLLAHDININGWDQRFPIVTFQGMILDGRNRWLACQEEMADPTFVEFLGSEEDAKQFVIRANELRRHLAFEWLEEHRARRVAQVREARSNGESLRSIADHHDISVSQVIRDIEVAGVPGGVHLTRKSVGRDGKKYPSKRAPAPPKNPEDAVSPGEVSGAGRDGCLDELGDPIPQGLLDTFVSKMPVGIIDNLRECVKDIRDWKMLNPYLDVDGIAIAQLESIVSQVDVSRPYALCTVCAGVGCQDCRNAGWLPEWRHIEVEGAGT